MSTDNSVGSSSVTPAHRLCDTRNDTGGETVMYHSYYYPDDVDDSVAYVAPLTLKLRNGLITLS
jgi:hypothetical protein